MLTAFVFDVEQSKQVEDWAPALERLDQGQLLWLALHDPTEEEVAALQETLELGDERTPAARAPEKRLRSRRGRAHVRDPVRRERRRGCAGAHPSRMCPWPELDRHRLSWEDRGARGVFQRAQGGGQIGALDAPSFVATIIDWIVASYLRALDAVESELEELDARVMTNTPSAAADDLTRLVELRRTIGTLRRALSPHREVVVSLSHPELDALSSEK